MIKQSKLLKIKSEILSNLFNVKYGLKLGELNIIQLGLKGLITVQMIKSEILSNLFNEKYGNKLGELNNSTGTERVKFNAIFAQKITKQRS